MSIDFRPLTPIRMADLFDSRLEKAGVREHHNKNESYNGSRCLTDGCNFLWVFPNDEGLVSIFVRWFPNGNPGRILGAISDEFGVKIVSEHEPEYWGFKTTEEWEKWEADLAAKAAKDEQDFYDEVVKFVRGESHNIRSGTNGMMKAEIAKRLVAESPELLAKDKRPRLIKAVDMIYTRDHSDTPF